MAGPKKGTGQGKVEYRNRWPSLREAKAANNAMEERNQQRTYESELAKIQKVHDQQRQDMELAYHWDMLHVRPNPPEPPPAEDPPGWIAANDDARRWKPKPETSYGVLYDTGPMFTWRHYAALWIALDVIGTAVTIYHLFQSRF